MTLLKVNDLTKVYDKHPAVNHVNFHLQKGRCIALIGQNGAGKTTILRMLAGLLKPTEGKVQFAGTDPKADIRQYIGYLPQAPAFYSWMTGEEFLIYCARLCNLSKREAKDRATELLQTVGIKEAKNKQIRTYSGGMKQRLGIAQALIHQPKLLLLDEPVSALDPVGRRDVLTLMEQLKEDMTILFSTHILSDAEEISDELLLIHDGKIVESGSLEQLRIKYQTATIEISYSENVRDFHDRLKKLPFILSTSLSKRTISLNVKNITYARNELLTLAANEKWPIDQFLIKRATLEDMFMKVVNE